jgi:hypothetical protein
MNKWFLPGALALAVSATLLAAACGGDDDTGNAPATGTPASDASPASNASPATQSTASASPTAGQQGGNASIPDDLRSLAGELARATYTATYDVTQPGTKATMKFAQDGKNTYLAVESDQGGIIIISTEKDTFSCFKAGTTGFCSRQAPDPSVSTLDIRQSLEDFATGGSTFKRVDDRKVGGLDSACWQIGADSTSTVLCVAKKEKVPTLLEQKSAGTSLTLKEYSGKVDGKLFEPPFPVQ